MAFYRAAPCLCLVVGDMMFIHLYTLSPQQKIYSCCHHHLTVTGKQRNVYKTRFLVLRSPVFKIVRHRSISRFRGIAVLLLLHLHYQQMQQGWKNMRQIWCVYIIYFKNLHVSLSACSFLLFCRRILF
jgi:hypothetical protein